MPLVGTVSGLDADGRLILQTGAGPVSVVAGHVELLG